MHRSLLLQLLLGMHVCVLGSAAAARSEQSDAGGASIAEKKNSPTKIVTIEVNGATINDVLRLLFDQAGEKGVFSESESTGRKLTAMLKEIPFETALTLVANAAGLRVEKKDNAWVLTFSYRPTLAFGLSPTHAQPWVIRCSSCSRSATLLRPAPVKPGTCSLCGRAQQSEWEFCPSCGAKRANDANEFAYCPFCGKALAAATANKESTSTKADVAALRAQLAAAEAELEAARARLANSHGKLLKQQNEAALRQAEANVMAVREKLKQADATAKKRSSLIMASVFG